MDQCLHRVLHFGAARRRHLMVGRQDRPWCDLKLFKALFHNANRLLHFLDAAQITVPAVTALAEHDIEVELIIAFVRLRLAQVPSDVRTTQHHAGKAPVEGLLLRHNADIDVALLEDAVFRDQ